MFGLKHRGRLVLGVMAAGMFASHGVASAAQSYTVDGIHSSLVFRVKHMGVSYVYGRFNKISGNFALDESDASNSRIDVEIATDSVDTGDANRDRHLQSPDFFNARQFPKITFKSTKVEKDGDAMKVTGDLTLRDVTRSVTITVETVGTGTHARTGKPIAGIAATFTIKRSDFGMDYGVNNKALSDEVKIMVALEGAGE